MKLKKLLTCTLAVMLMASICFTSFAEVMYVKSFYDEAEKTLYYFGKFDKNKDVDVGVEINEKEYSLNKDGKALTNIAKLMDTNFGIGLKFEDEAEIKDTKVKIYSKDGEETKTYYGNGDGKEFVFDPSAPGEDIVLSSASAEFGVMAPAFSAEVYEYYIGLYEDGNIPDINYTLPEGVAASVDKAENINESTVITVSSGEKSRAYTFNFKVISPMSSKVTLNASDSYSFKHKYASDKYDVPFIRTNLVRIDYWRTQKTIDDETQEFTNISDGSRNTGIFTYDFSGEPNIDVFGKFNAWFKIYYPTYTSTGGNYTITYPNQKYKVVAYAVENNDYDFEKSQAAETLKDSKMVIGREVASVTLSNVTSEMPFSIDISDYAREQLNKGNKKFSIALAVTELSEINDTWGELIYIWNHTVTSAGRTPYITCESADSKAYLTNIEISDENAVLAPSFNKDVTNYKIGLPAGSEIPEITPAAVEGATATVKTKAEDFGEATVISVVSEEGAYKEYSFTFEKILNSEETSVKIASINDVTTVVRNNPDAVLAEGTRASVMRYTTNSNLSYMLIKFSAPDFDIFGKYKLQLTTASVGENVKIKIHTVNNSEWSRSSATWNNTFGAQENPMKFDTLYEVSGLYGAGGTSHQYDITELVRYKLLNNNGDDTITLAVEIDADQDLKATSADTENGNVNLGYYSKTSDEAFFPQLTYNKLEQIAELKSAAPAGEGIAMYPSFSKDVTSYNVGVPAGMEIPDIIFEAEDGSKAAATSKASAYGEETVITVTSLNGSISKDYRFKFEKRLESTETSVKIASINDVTTVVRNNPDAVLAEGTRATVARYTTNSNLSYMLIKFNVSDFDIYGSFKLQLTTANDGENVKIKIHTVNNSDWSRSSATWNNTFGAQENPMKFDTLYEVSGLYGKGGTSYQYDITELLRYKLLNNNGSDTITLAVEIDAEQDLVQNFGSSGNAYLAYYSKINSDEAFFPQLTYNKIESKTPVAALDAVTLSGNDNAVMTPSFDKDVTTYYIGVNAGEAIPEINYTVNGESTVTSVTKATAIGEETVITVKSDYGDLTKDYRFIYEEITKSDFSKTTASASYCFKSNDGTAYTNATYDALYTYASGIKYYSVMKFDLSKLKSITRYDKFVIGLNTSGAIAGGKAGTSVTYNFNEVKCVSADWERAAVDWENFEIGNEIGVTEAVFTENSNSAFATCPEYIYCDITEFVYNRLTDGDDTNDVITIAASMNNISDFNGQNFLATNVYRADHQLSGSVEHTGPWIIINQESAAQ